MLVFSEHRKRNRGKCRKWYIRGMKLNTQRPQSSAPNYSSNDLLTSAGREPTKHDTAPCVHTRVHTPDLVNAIYIFGINLHEAFWYTSLGFLQDLHFD